MTYDEILDLLPQFPSLLPCPNRSAYTTTLRFGVLSTTMATGRQRRRAKFSDEPNLVTVPLTLTGKEKELLDLFLEDKLNQATSAFATDIHWDEGVKRCKVEIASPIEPYIASPSKIIGSWDLQLKMRILVEPPKIPYDLKEMQVGFEKLDTFCDNAGRNIICE